MPPDGDSAGEIVGRQFRCLFTSEDQRADRPSELLQAADRVGRFGDEISQVRNNGERFRTLAAVPTVAGVPAVMVNLAPSCRPDRQRRRSCTRRAFLGATFGGTFGAIAGAPVAGGGASAAAPDETMLRIVVVGGHPGDPEYGCGGTIARYTDLGHQVTLLYLNRGEDLHNGETDCPEIDPEHGSAVRVAEAAAACAVLNAHAVFADQCNGHAIVDLPHYDDFSRILQALEPDVVFNQWPIDNHPDHRAMSSLAYEAWVRMGRTPALYYYEVSDGEDTLMFSPSDYVDITATEPRKREACYAHASQTPDRYYALQSQVARVRGLEAGYAQAEAFVRHVRSRRGLLP
jgi:N-acetylglucosamine malate deacetylase 1